MSIRKSDGDFFKSHWDKLAALGGVVALLGVVVFNVLFSSDDSDYGVISGAGARSHNETAKNDITALAAVFSRVSKPEALSEIPDDKKSFLASELRVSCSSPEGKGCGRPIPDGLKVCPHKDCLVKQSADVKVIVDADEDGLLDDYERKFGLDPAVADADTDKDGDGFSNMDEFKANTNPSDSLSHPSYLDYIAMAAPLKQEFSTLQFTGTSPLGDDFRYYFKQPGRQNEVDRGNLKAVKGGEISNEVSNKKDLYKAGYIVVGFEKKTVYRTLAGGMKLPKDVSEVALKRVSDGKIIKFVIGAPKTPTDVQATLSCDRAGVGSITVVEGQKFKIKDEEYVVVKILGKGNGQARETVMIRNIKTEKARVIEALE